MQIRYCVLLLAVCLAVFSVSCGATSDSPGREAARVSSPSSRSSVNATEEYLNSLPLRERQVEQWKLDTQEWLELKQDARKQMREWVDDATPKCEDFFGTRNCRWVIVELEESAVCGYKHSRQIREADMEKTGHYYGVLVNEQGRISGGYHWIASYQHLAYQDGAVLNITQCWNQNPGEYVMD